MNYAEKELREAMAYLDEARANHDAIKAIQRALQLGQPVEVSFRTAQASVKSICPNKASEKLLTKLEQQAFERVMNLEKQEAYWCQELAFAEKQRQINDELRLNPDRTFNEVKQEIKVV